MSAGRLRHLGRVYMAGDRRRGLVSLAVGVAIELRVALLLGDLPAGGRKAILVSLVVRRVPLRLRYHIRRCGCKRANLSLARLDCCTGRARTGRC